LAATDYGGEFSAAVRLGNFHGVQFHPERSAAAGSRVLANFLGLA
jgi:glutamine amidotransferase